MVPLCSVYIMPSKEPCACGLRRGMTNCVRCWLTVPWTVILHLGVFMLPICSLVPKCAFLLSSQSCGVGFVLCKHLFCSMFSASSSWFACVIPEIAPLFPLNWKTLICYSFESANIPWSTKSHFFVWPICNKSAGTIIIEWSHHIQSDVTDVWFHLSCVLSRELYMSLHSLTECDLSRLPIRNKLCNTRIN